MCRDLARPKAPMACFAEVEVSKPVPPTLPAPARRSSHDEARREQKGRRKARAGCAYALGDLKGPKSTEPVATAFSESHRAQRRGLTSRDASVSPTLQQRSYSLCWMNASNGIAAAARNGRWSSRDAPDRLTLADRERAAQVPPEIALSSLTQPSNLSMSLLRLNSRRQ